MISEKTSGTIGANLKIESVLANFIPKIREIKKLADKEQILRFLKPDGQRFAPQKGYSMRSDRLQKIVAGMREAGVDQMILSDPSTIYYLTGSFVAPGLRMLVLLLDSQGKATFYINALQSDYAGLGEDIVWYQDSQDPVKLLAQSVRENARVAVDKNWSANFLLRLMAEKKADYCLSGQIVDRVRMVKDEGEIAALQESCLINEKVIDEMISLLGPDRTEQQHHRLLHEMYCKYGADGYNIIGVVAYGKSCGYAHHKADDTRLAPGDSVIIDIGARYKGYRSDMTRTVFYKSASDEMREIYKIVLEAQLTAMDAVKAGVRFCDIDKIGRDIITKYGYGEYFTHRIGHNIGIDGHEFPDVGGANEMEILPGMCFSVEPGIYIPGKGGVRIEDLVVAREDGYHCFYTYPKKELRIVE